MEYIRKARVAQFNKMLPMLQTTLKRQEQFYKIISKENELKEKLKRKTKSRELLEEKYNEISKKRKKLEKRLFSEEEYFIRRSKIIYSENGFIKPEEIKMEFLKEYIFLFTLLINQRRSILITNFFTYETCEVFFYLLVQKYGKEQADCMWRYIVKSEDKIKKLIEYLESI